MLSAAALAPPAMKTPLFSRLCAALLRRQAPDSKILMRTNLGISFGLRCYVTLEKAPHVFGRPEHNISERSTLALVSLLSRDCAHFIDVGANEGVFTFVVSRICKDDLKLHWFEPDEELFARTEQNLALNNIAAEGNKAAVSSSCGTAMFHKNLSDDASGSLTDLFMSKHETREQTVETSSLDDYFLGHQIDEALVKVDVEGHGSGVWEGARTVAAKIKYLVMEVIEPETRTQLPARIIAEAGWHAYYLRDFDLVHSPDGSYDYVAPFWNWLFCPMTPGDLAQRLAKTRFRVCGRT
jgi:FkbM family methyltransferase